MELQQCIRVAGLVVAVSFAVSSAIADDQPCEPEWSDAFPWKDLYGVVHDVVEFDDGTGPALYVGGTFTHVKGMTVGGLARWDGESWSDVFEGVGGGQVHALAVFDDGSGPALFIAGRVGISGFSGQYLMAKYDGKTFTPIGQASIGKVNTLKAFHTDEGPLLFLAGDFHAFDYIPTPSIAAWNGESLVPVVSPRHLVPTYYDAEVFDDGTGPAIYFAGKTPPTFSTDGIIDRLDGDLVTPAFEGFVGLIYALAAVDEEQGQSLWAGGAFTAVGSQPVSGVVRWDGDGWQQVGEEIALPVRTLTIWDDGHGPAVYAGGDNSFAKPESGIWRWSGEQWQVVGGGVQYGPVHALRVVGAMTEGGSALAAAGEFVSAGPVAANSVAVWDGRSWSAIGSTGGGTMHEVRAIVRFDDGTGPAIYAAGKFAAVGPITAWVARWTGEAWEPVATSLLGIADWAPPSISRMMTFDDGSGPALYVAGSFKAIDGVEATNIAKWDGTSWSAMGAENAASPLVTFDDGNGAALYGTSFCSPNYCLKKWDGSEWSVVAEFNKFIGTARVIDLADGPCLYIGGQFTMAAGLEANGIVRWDGVEWYPLGSGLSWGSGSALGVHAIEVFDFGNGPHVLVGGNFETAGGHETPKLAAWNGKQWHPGPLIDIGPSHWVKDLCRFDEGDGEYLVIARQSGVSHKWFGPNSELESLGVNSTASTFYRDFEPATNRPTLWIGGWFGSAGGVESVGIAQRIGCLPDNFGDLNGDGSVGVADLLILLAAWGPCSSSIPCTGDLNGDGNVGLPDLLILLANWQT